MNLAAIEPLEKLGIKLIECDGQQASFKLPLAGNRNDKGTLFAGSQYSALVISGWYLASQWASENAAELKLSEQVAIKDCHVSYPKAASTGVIATARFIETPDLRPSGHWRARIEVTASDEHNDVCSRLIGDYRLLVSPSKTS